MLVTGGGGSIGSELCRQVAQLGASKLVLVEQAESALYEMQRELVDERHFTAVIPVLADCGDAAKMRQVFERYPPEVVFHAAAYKHVPMLETNPLQAVTNNVLATRVIVQVSVEFGVDRFVFISTDKAAKPQQPARPVEGGLRVDRRVVRPARRRLDPVRRGALRQRPRLVRLGDPDLPAPDRARRPADGHERRDDALLHDDPGGGLARDPVRRDGRQGPGLRSRHGPARQDPRPRPADDRALRPDRGRHQDRVRRLTGGREDARGALERRRGDRCDLPPEDHARREPADRGGLARRTSSPSSRCWSPRTTCSALPRSSARWSPSPGGSARPSSKTRCTERRRAAQPGRAESRRSRSAAARGGSGRPCPAPAWRGRAPADRSAAGAGPRGSAPRRRPPSRPPKVV